MGIFDSKLFSWMQPRPRRPTAAGTRPLPVTGRARLTHNDESGTVPFGATLPPSEDTYDYWRISLSDPEDLAALSVSQIQKIIARVSPEVSKAWWDFVIFVGNMVEVKAYREKGREEVDEAAQAAVDEFTKLLDDQSFGTMNTIHRIVSGGFMRGAFAAELVINEAGNMPVDLVAPDPSSFRFREIEDVERGLVWELGQWQDGRWVSFRDLPTVKYVPIVPEVGSPYAVSWMEAAVFPGLFLIMILQDIKRVIANFGYPREDVTIDLERLMSSMPIEAQGDPQKQQAWINETIDEVCDAIEALTPGDAWVHTDVARREDLKGAIGGQGANFATQVDQLINSLERMLIRGLKTIPFLLASRQSTTERQADREWEAYTSGIDIVQRKLKLVLDRLFTLALEVQGIQAYVSVEFAETGAYDALRDAQVEQVRIANEIEKRKQGWISNDEASETITGSPAVGEPATFTPIPAAADNTDNTDAPDNNELMREIRRARVALAGVLGVTEPHKNGHISRISTP